MTKRTARGSRERAGVQAMQDQRLETEGQSKAPDFGAACMMKRLPRMNTKHLSLSVFWIAFGSAVLGCAAPSQGEAEGTTSSDLLAAGDRTEPQLKMHAAIQLLQAAASILDPANPAQPDIAQATDDVWQGIAWDNSHTTAHENQSNKNLPNVPPRTSLAQCAQLAGDPTNEADCLLQAAKAKLRAATWDKGGFRGRAILAIDQARSVIHSSPPPAPDAAQAPPSGGGGS